MPTSNKPDKPKDRTPERPVVPQYDVRNCIVCSQPMISRHCKYKCFHCGYVIDCSDAY